MPFLAEPLTITPFMISLPTWCKKHFVLERGVRSLTLKAPLNFSIKIYRQKSALFSWFSPSPAKPQWCWSWQREPSPPHPQGLWRGKALSPHSLVALSTGRLLPPHSNLSLALSKLNKPYSQGASDCSSHEWEEEWKYLFTGRHIYFCSLCLGGSTCQLQKLFSPVFFCIRGLLSWLKQSSWNKYLKRSDFTY